MKNPTIIQNIYYLIGRMFLILSAIQFYYGIAELSGWVNTNYSYYQFPPMMSILLTLTMLAAGFYFYDLGEEYAGRN